MGSCTVEPVTSKQRRRNLDNYARDFTGNSPGHINQKGQLVTVHPGTGQQWKCGICQEHLATNKAFEKHVKDKHQVVQHLYFCDCGFSSDSARSTGTHKRYCNGTPPAEHQLEHKCHLCKFSSATANGLLVHTSVAHKAEYNESLQEKENNYQYTEQELEYIAKIVYELKQTKARNINKVVAERVGRTEQAVQKVRTKTEFRRIERLVRERLKEQQGEQERLKGEQDRRDEGETHRREIVSSDTLDQSVDHQLETDEGRVRIQQTEEPRNPALQAYQEIPLEIRTPTTQVRRRQLPLVPPTPFNENVQLSQLLLEQSVPILNTPTVRRQLPETPTERSIRRRSASLPNIMNEVCSDTPRRPGQTLQGLAINQPVVSHMAVRNHNRQVLELRRQKRRPPDDHPMRRTTATSNAPQVPSHTNSVENNQNSRRRDHHQRRSIMKDSKGKPDYKRTAYADARSYAATLDTESELDKVLKNYLMGEGSLGDVTKVLASEMNKEKKPRVRKGPWMKNRREN